METPNLPTSTGIQDGRQVSMNYDVRYFFLPWSGVLPRANALADVRRYSWPLLMYVGMTGLNRIFQLHSLQYMSVFKPLIKE